MSPVEIYFRLINDIHQADGAAPASQYQPVLADLLNAIGQQLNPKVGCVLRLKEIGQTLPDGGLFTLDQFPKTEGVPQTSMFPTSPPTRGAIEVGSTADELFSLAYSQQIDKHLGQYHYVLVSNYRGFVLMGLDSDGKPTELESFVLAEDEAEFWALIANPRHLANTHGDRLTNYLMRAMHYAAPFTRPEHAAWFLASYAREADHRLELVTAMDPLYATSLLEALDDLYLSLETALALNYEGEEGAWFFRSTLIQTLFYAIFAAWVQWYTTDPEPNEPFDWRLAHWYLRSPLIHAFFRQVTQPDNIGTRVLDLEELFDWAGTILNRVDHNQFFKHFAAEQIVEGFCDPFLRMYSPRLRKALGIWYTPPEVARYMVARVDAVLREELGFSDGLANERVIVLDPCCGTGTFLVEALKYMAAALQQAKKDEVISSYFAKKAATKRMLGFEIMPAALVIAQLQLNLLLNELGSPLTPTDRTAIHLTNALTGWPSSSKPEAAPLLLPELQMEQDAVATIKHHAKIVVIIGNLPYNVPAGLRLAPTSNGPGRRSADSLALSFYHMTDRLITRQNDQALVCLLSDLAWLDNPAHKPVRTRCLERFDQMWIDSLNGDKAGTGNLSPQGEADPSIFSTRFNREGSEYGAAVALMVRTKPHTQINEIQYRDFWGKSKRSRLLESIRQSDLTAYQTLKPAAQTGYSFRPVQHQTSYRLWPAISDLYPISMAAVAPHLVDLDQSRLERRLRLQAEKDPAGGGQVDPVAAQMVMASSGQDNMLHNGKAGQSAEFKNKRMLRYAYRPFDTRYLYWQRQSEPSNQKFEALFASAREGAMFLVSSKKGSYADGNKPLYLTPLPVDRQLTSSGSVCFPILITGNEVGQPSLFDQLPDRVRANLSAASHGYLRTIGINDPEINRKTAGLMAYHTLAVGYAPRYLAENKAFLRRGWPRIPLPPDLETMQKSAALGIKIAALLNTDGAMAGVDSGAIRPELKTIGLLKHIEKEYVDPEGDLALTAGWGRPIGGKESEPDEDMVIERPFSTAERSAMEKGAAVRGLNLDQLDHTLGTSTCEIFLNDQVYWTNIPLKVWQFSIGGYQVIRTWLSDRELTRLERPLTLKETREITHIARRLTELVLLEPALDANYDIVKETDYAWPDPG